MKFVFNKKFIFLVIIFLLLFRFGQADAALVSSFSDVLSSQNISTAANHTIKFTTPSGISAGQSFSLAFASGFNIGSVDYTDIDLEDDGVDLSLANTASGSTWGVSFSGNTLTITSGTGSIAAGSIVTIEIGTNATSQTAGDQQITNPGTAGSYVIRLSGSFGDTGGLAVAILDNSGIGISATVPGGGTGIGGDSTPPVISNVQAINITTTSATITWDTDEGATSIVDYGLTDSYEIGSQSIFEFVTSHSIDLSGLTANTMYHFRVRSADSSGNSASSADYTFTTLEEEIKEGFLYLRAIPEKRLPASGNNSTVLRVKMYEAGTSNLVLDKTVTTSDNGYDNSISLSGLALPADFDFLIKGYSHLQHRKNSVTVSGDGELVDFSEGETVYEKAGDINGADGDNYVNGLDLSVLANHIYTDDYKSDLNQDKLVNGIEFAIAITNLFKWGDF